MAADFNYKFERECLKFMDPLNITLTFTHLLIIWTLLGALLIWIVLFAFLALRPEKMQPVEEPVTALTVATQKRVQPAVELSQQAHVSEQFNGAVPIA